MSYVYVGKLTGTHGLNGELKLKSSFSYIDNVLKSNFPFYIGDDKKEVKLLKSRNHNGIYLLVFNGYEGINLVENFRNSNLYVLRDDIGLKQNEYVFEDYIGLKAIYDDSVIGTIEDIIDCGNGNYVFSIIGNNEILIPVNEEFIKEVVLNDKVVFKDVGGLINAN